MIHAAEPKSTHRAERGGARLDDHTLRAAITSGIGSDSPRATERIVAAIREAERCADEREQSVEGVAQGVVRYVVVSHGQIIAAPGEAVESRDGGAA